ncbi:MAG: ABC transporter ATP-binding protein [Thermoanaerobaculia bacterium]
MASVDLRGVGKRFGEAAVLDGVSLAVAEGEVLVLLGRSGSGKTTLLRLVAGFETPDAGVIAIGGEDVTRVSPARRNVGMVFQHYALFPHLTVGENVAFGLARRELGDAARRERVAAMLELVELAGYGQRRIDQLSGGQQQRVALARALAPGPRLLLLDEPLSNLDPALRERTRRQLAATVRRVGLTALWVTHEQAEAFDVGDRVAVLEAGRIAQVGTPQELYTAPADRFVAGFVGRASWLPARLVGDRAEVDGAVLPWPVERIQVGEGAADLLLRPEQLALGSPAAAPLVGEIAERRFAGETTYFTVRLASGLLLEVAAPFEAARLGERVGVVLRPEGGAVRAYPEKLRSGGELAAPLVASGESRVQSPPTQRERR